MATTVRKVEGLAMFIAYSPFDGFSGAMLDHGGAWTAAMLEAHGDAQEADEDTPEHAGLAVWEGICTVTITQGDADDCESDADVMFDFKGAWRAPTGEEMARLALGRMPLRNAPMPAASSLIEVA